MEIYLRCAPKFGDKRTTFLVSGEGDPQEISREKAIKTSTRLFNLINYGVFSNMPGLPLTTAGEKWLNPPEDAPCVEVPLRKIGGKFGQLLSGLETLNFYESFRDAFGITREWADDAPFRTGKSMEITEDAARTLYEDNSLGLGEIYAIDDDGDDIEESDLEDFLY